MISSENPIGVDWCRLGRLVYGILVSTGLCVRIFDKACRTRPQDCALQHHRLNRPTHRVVSLWPKLCGGNAKKKEKEENKHDQLLFLVTTQSKLST